MSISAESAYLRVFRICQSALRHATDALLSVVLAPRCAVCDGVLDEPLSGPVCSACWSRVHFITPPVCDRCGDPLPAWRDISQQTSRCPRCRRAALHVDRGRTIGEYDGALRAIIHALKYQKRRSLARRLAALMRDRGAEVLHGADWIVPVPLHPRRRRHRGFNQAEDLARHLGLPVRAWLVRRHHTRPQVELPASQRHRNVRHAFEVKRRRWSHPFDGGDLRLSGRCVVLVDDVSTTGATLEACARVLKQAGVREVRALTAARVVWKPRA